MPLNRACQFSLKLLGVLYPPSLPTPTTTLFSLKPSLSNSLLWSVNCGHAWSVFQGRDGHTGRGYYSKTGRCRIGYPKASIKHTDRLLFCTALVRCDDQSRNANTYRYTPPTRAVIPVCANKKTATINKRYCKKRNPPLNVASTKDHTSGNGVRRPGPSENGAGSTRSTCLLPRRVKSAQCRSPARRTIQSMLSNGLAHLSRPPP